MTPRNPIRLANNLVALLVAAIVTSSCEQSAKAPPLLSSESLPGGAATLLSQAVVVFDAPVANLPPELKSSFYAGKALAEQPWVKAPTATTARDGLGPLYNARSCMSCHINGGRGRMPQAPDELLTQGVLRLSMVGEKSFVQELGVAPHPVLGDQLQTQSVALSHQLRHVSFNSSAMEVQPEAYIYLRWQDQSFTFPDGELQALRYPQVFIENNSIELQHSEVLTSLRSAPAVLGAGLIEAIPQAAINAIADAQHASDTGISGRVNRVWDPLTQSFQAGRFGWKASRANLAVTVAAAFVNDVGITNPIFPQQPCTEEQLDCLRSSHGSAPDQVELPQHLLDLVELFTQNLAVPRSRLTPQTQQGREYFYASGCQQCHQPSFVTGEHAQPHLSRQTIWPYSDFLLHDMGDSLADGRSDFAASGQEWRTPPLWGIGVSKKVNGIATLLHDGRARNVTEAILWHGGEAQKAKEKFIHLPKQQRRALVQFVESL